MPNIRTAVVIAKPIDCVFEFLAKPENCALWQGSSCVDAGGGALACGQQVIEELEWAERHLRINWIVQRSERPTTLMLEGRTVPEGSVQVSFSLESCRQGTRLVRNFRYEIPAFFDQYGSFFGLRNRLHAESAQHFRRLKRILETDELPLAGVGALQSA